MRHIFVVNPAAGSHDCTAEVKERLKAFNGKIDYAVHCTTGRGDATRFVNSVCEDKSENYRFYACGGDGTLNEVVNGAIGHNNASVSVLPCGSGNDFIKYFGTADDFNDLESLTNGIDHNIDIMKVGDKYSVNVVNFGFEPAVVKTMEKVKRKKFMTGKKAYFVGIAAALVNSMKTKARVFADGVRLGKDCLLLGSIANGRYVGGSFKCAPRAIVDDGELEVCIVNNISRMKFINLIGYYKNGTHLDSPKAKGIINYCRGKVIEVIGEDELCYCVDGELNFAKRLKVEVIKKAINFAVPRKIAEKLGFKERESCVC